LVYAIAYIHYYFFRENFNGDFIKKYFFKFSEIKFLKKLKAALILTEIWITEFNHWKKISGKPSKFTLILNFRRLNYQKLVKMKRYSAE